MRAVLPALAFVLATGAAALAVTDADLKTKIVGTWGESAACTEGALVFKADGSFISRDKDPNNQLIGAYEISDGKLNGKAEDHEMPEMTVSFDGETLIMSSGGNIDRLTRCTNP
ncbi:hypothetical protein BH10PSE9_BH10PSE9_20910 [soil metagenome]